MTSEIHLDRLRYVAGHYRELQGLSLVPFGLIFLAPGFIAGGWGQQGETWRWLAIIGDGLVNPPISVTAFVMAGLLLIPFVAARGRYRHHYLYLALLYVAVALLPLTGLVTSAQLVEDPWLFSVFYGLPWIIGGLGDHIFLMRSLKPLPQEAVDGGI